MFRVLNCLIVEHDWRLVILAGILCFLSSLASINLLRRAFASRTRMRAAWLIKAGVAAGCGIWSTHFIALLAYEQAVVGTYDVLLTGLSLFAAVVIVTIGFGIAISFPRRWGPAAGGAITGIGIACMHYLGMWALEIPGQVTWALDLVFVSILLGAVFGSAAITIALRDDMPKTAVFAGAMLTLAIVAHHFTAMGSVEIIADPARPLSSLSMSSGWLTLTIVAMAFAVLVAAFSTALADRRLSEQGQVLATALDHMSQSLCMFDGSHRLIVCNKRYAEMYKLNPELTRAGTPLRTILEFRVRNGTASDGDPDAFINGTIRRAQENRAESNILKLKDGRVLRAIRQPLESGGWVSTHEDITQQQLIEQRRTALAEQEKRRSTIDGAINAFRESIDTVLTTVGDSAAEMNATVTALSDSSSETSRSATVAVKTSNEASASVTAAATAAEELNHSISTISVQLQNATQLVQNAVSEARTANNEIASLAQSAQEIGDVVKVIRQIAGQTNLLALNATIEAARAGEAGRGFAVVASEVKSLAVQTAAATEQIAAQIAAVQASTTAAVEAIRRNTERMQEIDQQTAAVAGAITQQSAATNQISMNVMSAASGARDIVAVLDEVAGAVQKTRKSADTVLSASSAVEKAGQNLRQKVEVFLQDVAV